jgi:hypothetical protein
MMLIVVTIVLTLMMLMMMCLILLVVVHACVKMMQQVQIAHHTLTLLYTLASYCVAVLHVNRSTSVLQLCCNTTYFMCDAVTV